MRFRRIAAAASVLRDVLAVRRPHAALLVGFSEFNARLGRRLMAESVPVLWYAPPQIWAWRAGRGPRLARCASELAVLLPFEEPLWRRLGASVHFVGHPSTERPRATRESREAISVLPGSRDHEVRRHLIPALRAARSMGRPVHVVLSPSLSVHTARWAAAHVGSRPDTTVSQLDCALERSAAAIVSSGTATVDCIAAGVPPVIIYRADAITWTIARRLVRVRNVGLPNLVLGRQVFPELLQDAMTPPRLALALRELLGNLPYYRSLCDQARQALSQPIPPSQRVAESLRHWLDSAS